MAIHIHIGRQRARTRDRVPVRRVKDDDGWIGKRVKVTGWGFGTVTQKDRQQVLVRLEDGSTMWVPKSTVAVQDRALVRDHRHKSRDCACAECRDRRRVGGRDASGATERDLSDEEPRIVNGVKGVKSTPFTKKFRNAAEMDRWLESDEISGNVDIYYIKRA